jgi:purine-nucleoside phosphorylase
MSTAHNSANLGDFAKTVLLPGDPLRAKLIADTFFENPKLVNNVRGVQGYTGSYKGVPVSVMASGMGAPSMGIYSYELFTQYGVDNIIRIGSAGAISPELKLRDVVAAMGACYDSNFPIQYRLPGTFSPICNYDLLTFATASAKELGVRMPVGNLLSSDIFYDASNSTLEWAKMGCLAVEMEAAALYCTAAYTHKRALAICSVSNSLITWEELSADDRQNSFKDMMKIALEVAVKATALPDLSK